MFENLKNMAGMLGQARELRAKMEAMQAELGRQTVEADAGSGAVRVVMNGRFEVQRVAFDRSLLEALVRSDSHVDQRMIEDLVAAAVNVALAKVQELVRAETSRTMGINLPGLDPLAGP